MDNVMTSKDITVQGDGSPVPVREAGGGAGPSGPLASVCDSLPAVNQAGGDKQATGYLWQEIDDPSIRRSSLSRSPPEVNRLIKKGEQISILRGKVDPTRARLGSTGSVSRPKREREETTQEDMRNDLKKFLAKMTECSEELIKHIKTNVNTKAEIKKGIREMHWQLEVLNRKNLEWEELPTKPKARQVIMDTRIEKAMVSPAPKTTKSVGIQVNMEQITEEEEQRRLDERREIINIVDQECDFEGLSKILDKEWPEEVFQITKVEEKSTQSVSESGDLALIMDPSTDIQNKGLGNVPLIYPEIAKLIEEGLTEGQIEYIRNDMKTFSSKGGCEERSNVLFILPYKTDTRGINDISALYDIIKGLKIQMPTQKVKTIKVMTVGNHNCDYLRKCVEAIFRKTEHKVKIVTTNRSRLKSESKPSRQKTKGPPTDKIIVKSEGKSYADLLRTVKRNVDIAKVGVTIRSLKKTEKGDLLLEIAGGTEKAKILKEEIKSKTKDMEVIVKSNDATVHITDIDADLDEEDLKDEIIKNGIGIAKEQLRVLSLRPNRNGNQTATVQMRKDAAAELVARGKIKIGWVNCRLRFRAYITRCYKCLEFGHRTSECTGPDRSNICIKCGKNGHKAKDCEEENLYCMTCKQEGHRADNTKCPHFRKLIKDQGKGNKIWRRSVLQTNLGRCRAAHDIAYAVAGEKKADIIIISEPNVKLVSSHNYLVDNRKDVAIQIRNKHVGINRVEKGEGFVKLLFENWHLYGCYVSPNISFQEFKLYIDSIMVQIRDGEKEAIFAGDLNAKSALWGSPYSDERGNYVAEWAAELNLTIINTGTTPTFERGSSGTYIDVTGATANITKYVKGWEVLSGEVLTFHHHILFEVDQQKKSEPKQRNIRTFLDDNRFTESIIRKTRNKEIKDSEDLMTLLEAAVRESTIIIRNGERERPYWWSIDIENQRAKCLLTRRRITRANARNTPPETKT
ncbi:hypothetical protein NQ317_004768 [Molorchus minor]|uniref:CCHC-type domain-containing protein n=1 Tax=Molorchus minor TaxID=1323400 RepID=A0ABQ9JI81_9CUCU|nr:hypothetical protein NQ317_004768 [Molorchus minor]